VEEKDRRVPRRQGAGSEGGGGQEGPFEIESTKEGKGYGAESVVVPGRLDFSSSARCRLERAAEGPAERPLTGHQIRPRVCLTSHLPPGSAWPEKRLRRSGCRSAPAAT